MPGNLKTHFLELIQSYIFISILALIAGIVFPQKLSVWAFLITPILQIIFFLSSLKINVGEVLKYLKDFKSLLAVNAFMMILLPVIVWFITRAIAPELALALMLLAAMPAGMTTPLLTEVVEGNVNYSLVLTVTTSLLAPLTIPLVIQLLAGSTVEVEFLPMFLKLVYVIFIPFVLAQILKKYFHPHIKKSYFTFKPISLVLLGILIAVLVAQNVFGILSDFNRLLFYLIAVIAFFIFTHIIGYFLTFWQKHKERLTVSVGVTYMNFVLAIYLAGTYFNKPNVILPLIASILPWTLFLIPFKKILIKITHKS